MITFGKHAQQSLDSDKPVTSCESREEQREEWLNQCNDQIHISIMDLPDALMDEIFLFSGLISYVLDVVCVCKRWSVNNIDDIVDNKAHLVRQLIWNSCKRVLFDQNALNHYSLSEYDLIYESELSAAYTCNVSWTSYNAWTPPWPFRTQSQSELEFTLLHSNVTAEKLPKYSLYFDTEIRMRKIKSYRYLFHFIHLTRFDGERTLDKLCVLLLRLSMNGGALFVAFMSFLLLLKYASGMMGNPPVFHELHRDYCFKYLMVFEAYFKHFEYYMEHKQEWVIRENLGLFSMVSRMYWPPNTHHPWLEWKNELIAQNKYNELCETCNEQ
eukprot:112004_1